MREAETLFSASHHGRSHDDSVWVELALNVSEVVSKDQPTFGLERFEGSGNQVAVPIGLECDAGSGIWL